MRSLRRGTIWSAGRRWLWAGSFGVAMTGTAVAQDCAPGGCCTDGCGPNCCALHEENAARMREAYGRLLTTSSTCCPDTCAVPSDICADACADECCPDECGGGCCGGELGEPWTLSGALCGNDPCNPPAVTIGGWTQNGFHDNSDGLFNSHPNQIVSHQNYLYAERVADGSQGMGFGFRGDFMYGADAQDTQAFGEPYPQEHWDTDWDRGAYGSAIPQLYAEVAFGNLSVKAGKFYTPVGYTVVTAPDNFFYSVPFTMYTSEPFTHSGFLGTYSASDNTTLYGGWVAGWDTGFDRFSDGDDSEGSAAIFGFGQGIGENLTVTYIGLAGDMGVNGEGYNHSVVADLAIGEKWNYVFQTDYVHLNFDAISVVNYLFYNVSDKFAIGGRAEWWKSNLLTGGAGWESAYETTFGVNYKPIANLVIRPEYRYQWGTDNLRGLAGAVSDSGPTGQPAVVDDGIFAVDAILTF